MELIPWNDNYSINIKEIDNQHRGLFLLMNGLHQSMLSGKAKVEVDDIVGQLIDYTHKHFDAEEKLMLKYHYPGYEKHKAEHEVFVEKVDYFKHELVKEDKVLSAEILTFLSDWLINHIIQTDKEMQPFLEEKMEE